MDAAQVDRYLHRIGLPRSVPTDLAGLTLLQRSHLANVPFENLDIVFAGGVPHDRNASFTKIVDGAGRGGWCFELNGLFALLLEALGFDVLLLGAAVLFDGPTTIIEHLALEVSGGSDDLDPHLVDVGFGDSFNTPLALNRAGPQSGGHTDYELLPSPQGTTLAQLVNGVPEAHYRFKRVAHDFDDFAGVARSMQVDPNKHWASKPFATRLLSAESDDRVTLTHDRIKFRRGDRVTEESVSAAEWNGVLDEWFGIELPESAT